MENRLKKCLLCSVIVLFAIGVMPVKNSNACSRAVYFSEDTNSSVITMRSMDWPRDMGSNLWAFPSGIARTGASGKKSIKWTSKYNSVVVSSFEDFTPEGILIAGSADGMNEMGLVANLLYLSETVYVKPSKHDKRKRLALSAWTQYVLDNFDTVEKAVTDIQKNKYYIVQEKTPDGARGTMHLAISDATGDSAIFEYIDGKLVVHHGRQYQVMTNSPVYDSQLALNAYWKEIGGLTMLPGTNRAADRFVRASFYIKAIPQNPKNNREAVASAFSVIRNVSVPLGISTTSQPEISSTLWRTVSDNKFRRYYFESANSPSVIWVNLLDMVFTEGKAKKLTLIRDGRKDLSLHGNVTSKFHNVTPYQFIPAVEAQPE